MVKKNNVSEARGAEDSIPDLKTVSGWVKDDCARSISFLTAIHSDPDLIQHMAEFMLGRMTNAKNAKLQKEAALNGKA